jgi:hypothetical protein
LKLRPQAFISVLTGHPVDCDDTRAGLLKIAALYTMNPQ